VQHSSQGEIICTGVEEMCNTVKFSTDGTSGIHCYIAYDFL
jgi:hypothetical protein